MKRLIKILIVSFAIAALFSVLAFADDPIVDGIYDVQMESGFDIEFQDADKKDVTGQSGTAVGTGSYEFFPGAEQFDISFNATSGKYYMVFVLEDDNIPTADNIVFIDQMTAGSTPLTLHAYPSAMKTGKTYNIYITSNDGVTTFVSDKPVGSFKYYQAYTLGDVDGDGEVKSKDANLVLRYSAELEVFTGRQLLSANVTVKNGSTEVDSRDALMILRYAAEIIHAWE